TYAGGTVQIFAGQDSDALTIGTHATTDSAPIKFNTSIGNNALSTEKARITGEGNMGIATNDPTERLDIGSGNMRIRDINTNVGDADDRIVVADEDGVLKSLKAAMPKFFYMPSIIVPTSEEQLNNPASGQVTGDAFDDNTLQGTINLYGRYEAQFGTPMVSNGGSTTTLPVLPATELDYHITWYDTNVFTLVSVSDSGVLTYTVDGNADITVGSFMNIVFSVKED